jgi:hypothetical protein
MKSYEAAWKMLNKYQVAIIQHFAKKSANDTTIMSDKFRGHSILDNKKDIK